jgi:pimeloyl-ACP methyl ester carboxylesterase
MTLESLSDLRRRIVFVPGMKPKPPAEIHRQALLRVLIAGIERIDQGLADELGRHEELFELVPWTYQFYGTYRDIGLDLPGIDRAIERAEPDLRDVTEIESLNRRVRRWVHIVGDAFPFLTRWLAKRDVRLTLWEARHYLNDWHGVAAAIRSQLAAVLIAAWEREEKIILIGHSLGSVIAYDTLWQLTHQRGEQHSIDMFVTLGSPLATRFIRRHLQGANLSGPESYPHNIERWVNFSARGEMTAIHPELEPSFGSMVELGLLQSLQDHADFYNHFRGDTGLNVHKSYGYLLSAPFLTTLVSWLREQG